MKKGLSLPELAREVTRVNNSKKDFIVDSRSMEAKVLDNEVVLALETDDGGEQTFGIRKTMHDQLMTGDNIKVPRDYGRRMLQEAPELYCANLNHWLKNQDDKIGKRMVRTIDGDARAYLSPRYRRLDNFDLLTWLLPTIKEVSDEFKTDDNPEPWTVVSSQLTEDKMYLKLLLTGMPGFLQHRRENTRQLRPDRSIRLPQGWESIPDVELNTVYPMVTISNSEIGNGMLTILPGTFEWWCANGSTREEYSTRKMHVGKITSTMTDSAVEMLSDETLAAADRAFWMSARDVLRGVLKKDVFEKILKSLDEAYGMPITGEAKAATVVLANKIGLAEDEQDMVLQALIDGRDLTLGGLVAAVTWTAQADSVDYDRASELEMLGGRVLSMGSRDLQAILTATN